ncbi:unnamed protein product [Linum trigynum]|uniref:Uncharacterized protein n=1 Tax=Linum trigynum TaxID=586398 RepID=A0AAV2CF97_9ROSI
MLLDDFMELPMASLTPVAQTVKIIWEILLKKFMPSDSRLLPTATTRKRMKHEDCPKVTLDRISSRTGV